MKAIITYVDGLGERSTKEIDLPIYPVYISHFMTKIGGVYVDKIISIDVKPE